MWEYLNAVGIAALFFGATVAWVLLMSLGLRWLLTRVSDWWDHRRGRRTPEEKVEYWQRRQQLQLQLWDMERQIREEQMSEEEREWHRQYRERQQEIRREARRRLGLPEEEG